MDLSTSNSKNILMELESLKSKESIFKMKEINYVKDKEILEESIKSLQKDLQERGEIIRVLRKDLDSQSSSLFRDLTIKGEELDKTVLENNDLSKKLTIAMETIDHFTKRNEKLRIEFDKQKTNFDRESECKSKLVEFYETSCSQKDTKIASLSSDIGCLKSDLLDVESQFQKQKQINEDLRNNIMEIKSLYANERLEKEQEIQKAKLEILQLQQNGISELHLEKMNPVVAITIKALKSSKSLMDIYSELHNVISERDYLQLEKNRLIRSKEEFETRLDAKETEISRLTIESDESLKIIDNLKSRLLSLVSELRTSETKRGKVEREILLAKQKSETSEKEVVRLMEQVRVLLLAGETGENIKQEPVDVDSAMYTSVQELQEVNRVLRNDNDILRKRLEESDIEQFKHRCNELQTYSDSLKSEVEHLRHENKSFKNLLLIHEKEVKMLRYLIELKSPGSKITIEKALRSLKEGVKCNVEIVGECEEMEQEYSSDNVLDVVDESERIAKLENDISEILDNKKASDQIFVSSIESMRTDFLNKNRLSIDLFGKLEELTDKYKEEREINENYRKETELLRAINKNLSQNTSALESQADEFKLKLECKISELAEKKAEIERFKSQLKSSRSQQMRLVIEKDEIKKTLGNQEEILKNIRGVQNMANLKDHLCLSNMQHKLQVLEETVHDLSTTVKEKDDEICSIRTQLNESKLIEEEYKTLCDIETCEAECQVSFIVYDPCAEKEPKSPLNSISDQSSILIEYQNKINVLEDDIQEMNTKYSLITEQIESNVYDMDELQKKCDFYESQLNILEKAKQEVLNENIKLTEEAHNLNSFLKQDILKHQEALSKMKVRLEEAENVERTAQSVIDKYVKECNEAKAKYKRELTLHANDSKQLDAIYKEIEELTSRKEIEENKCKKLKAEMDSFKEKTDLQLFELQSKILDLEHKLRSAEYKNNQLYDQLMQVSDDNSNKILNEVINDLRGQIKVDKLSCNLSNVEKEKYEYELERLRSELVDLNDQLCIEKERSSMNICVDETNCIATEIIKESNQVLREQKLALDRVVLTQRTEIEDFVEQVTCLKNEVSSLEVKYNNLMMVKTELEEERTRWKERCTKLIESADQMDPEKYRIACNDRDRFEKQVIERESNCKEIQIELNNAREELKVLINSLVEERNKNKKEETVGLQLKEIARKYKGEAEKKRHIIAELEQGIEKLNRDKSELMVEKQEVITNLQTLETELESTRRSSSDEKELMVLEMSKIKLELDSRIIELIKEKEGIESSLQDVKEELQIALKRLEVVNIRCDLLEQMEKEKTFKLQLTENIIVRLKEENENLKVSQSYTKNMKRGMDEEINTEHQSKRQKLDTGDTAEDSSENIAENLTEDTIEEIAEYIEENITEDIAENTAEDITEEMTEDVCVYTNAIEDQEECINKLEEGQDQNKYQVEIQDSQVDNTNNPKIWWNVNSNADEELINQIQINLEQYEVEDGEYDEEDENGQENNGDDKDLTEECLRLFESINEIKNDVDEDDDMAANEINDENNVSCESEEEDNENYEITEENEVVDNKILEKMEAINDTHITNEILCNSNTTGSRNLYFEEGDQYCDEGNQYYEEEYQYNDEECHLDEGSQESEDIQLDEGIQVGKVDQVIEKNQINEQSLVDKQNQVGEESHLKNKSLRIDLKEDTINKIDQNETMDDSDCSDIESDLDEDEDNANDANMGEYDIKKNKDDYNSESGSNSSSVVIIDDSDDENEIIPVKVASDGIIVELNTSEEKEGDNVTAETIPQMKRISPPKATTDIQYNESNVSRRGRIRKLNRRPAY